MFEENLKCLLFNDLFNKHVFSDYVQCMKVKTCTGSAASVNYVITPLLFTMVLNNKREVTMVFGDIGFKFLK